MLGQVSLRAEKFARFAGDAACAVHVFAYQGWIMRLTVRNLLRCLQAIPICAVPVFAYQLWPMFLIAPTSLRGFQANPFVLSRFLNIIVGSCV